MGSRDNNIMDDSQSNQSVDGEQNSGGEFRQKFEQLQNRVKALEPLERENTMLRLGINPDDGKAKLFTDAYTGEWTPEAVTEAIKGYGLDDLLSGGGNAQQQQQQPAQPDAQQQAAQFAAQQMQQLGQLHTGANPQGQQPVDYSTAASAEEVLEMYRANGGVVAMD